MGHKFEVKNKEGKIEHEIELKRHQPEHLSMFCLTHDKYLVTCKTGGVCINSGSCLIDMGKFVEYRDNA